MKETYNMRRAVSGPFLYRGSELFSDRKQRIYDFLRENPVGVLCSVDPRNNPHGVVVYFTTDKNFVTRFITKNRTRKYDNLMHNDHVMLTTFDVLMQSTLQITGVAHELSKPEDIDEVATAVLGSHLQPINPGGELTVRLDASEFTAFEIVPTLIRMAVYAPPEPGKYHDLFESIESFELENDD